MFGRDAMDIVLDLAVSGEKLFGRGIFELETRPQSLAGIKKDRGRLEDGGLGPRIACGVVPRLALNWTAGNLPPMTTRRNCLPAAGRIR